MEPDRIIAVNLQCVRERIQRAAESAGRAVDSIRLIGVTKYVGVEQTRSLVRAGCYDLGESRPQSLWDKAAQLSQSSEQAHAGSVAPKAEDQQGETAGLIRPSNVRWHLIGHLQRNKIARTIAFDALLHSIDSIRLLDALQASAESQNMNVRILIEINISGEPSKTGFARNECLSALQHAASLNRVQVEGLMGMAALEGGEMAARRDFAAMQQLQLEMQQRQSQGEIAKSVGLSELSMGMSDDFEWAIAHGATMIRVGSALFDGITDDGQ
jgi:PLP dependent protein